MSTKLPKSEATNTVRICMIQRGMSRDSLSAACGIKPQTLSSQIAKDFPIRRIRLAIEAALGQPFWSSREDFAVRLQLTRHCGFDPFTASDAKVRAYAATLKLHGRSQARRKGALIALLQSHFTRAENINT